MNTLIKLLDYGQSYWLDNLTRQKITGGELEKRVQEQGLRGITSNPSIFNKAISESEDYHKQIKSLVEKGTSLQEIYEALTVKDVQDACDVLRPVFEESDGVDGFVSLEVSPYLARDTEGTMKEVRRLFKAVDRPNCFIKIPGTREGLPAIEQMLYEGVNVNITLLFSVDRYVAVAQAYLKAMQRRVEEDKEVSKIRSVASFFLSRIDVLTDQLLGHKIIPGAPYEDQPQPERLLGKTGIASARLAYQKFKQLFSGQQWEQLASKGAKVQRLLWASTSTKDPLYNDVRYVEALIGPDTVNTMPDKTIAAFLDHGSLEENTIEEDIDEAKQTFDSLSWLHIDIDLITQQLENEGIQKFIDPYDELMTTLSKEREKVLQDQRPIQEIHFGKLKNRILSAYGSLDEKRAGRLLFSNHPVLKNINDEGLTNLPNGLESLAVMMGVNVEELLPSANRMWISSDPHVPAKANPALQLGTVLGICAHHGQDKVMVITSSSIKGFSSYLQHLLAKSKGLTLLADEPLGSAASYSDDRLFIGIFLTDEEDQITSRKLKSLEDNGYPVVRIRLPDRFSIGGEWCRWKIAAAVLEMLTDKEAIDQSRIASSLAV